MLIALTLTTVVLLLLIFEKWYLNKQIKKIPLRILVNGTRGKSTVVKYISSLLRSNGLSTFSKITGVLPTIYYDDDKSEKIKRRGGARITEQFRMIREAVKRNADALVLENMSINSELQKIESSVIQPHYYVLTNILEDHLEEFGVTTAKRVEALCEAIPENCKVITSEVEHLESIKKYAGQKNSRVLTFYGETNVDLTLVEGSHIDNLKIVEIFAQEENLERDAFYSGINSLHKDESILLKYINGFKVSLINAFAANDVSSAIKLYQEKVPAGANTIMLFNSRGDRPYRTIKFTEWLATLSIDRYFITGDNTGLAKRKLLSEGIDAETIFTLNTGMCNSITEVLKEHINNETYFFGCGNIKNAGLDILKCFKEK